MPENLWFRELCPPDLHEDGATAATEQKGDGAGRKRLMLHGCTALGKELLLDPSNTGIPLQRHRLFGCELRNPPMRIFGIPMPRGQAVPWHCHCSSCDSSTLLRSTTLFPHPLVLCECTWVLLSLGLLCYWYSPEQPVGRWEPNQFSYSLGSLQMPWPTLPPISPTPKAAPLVLHQFLQLSFLACSSLSKDLLFP